MQTLVSPRLVTLAMAAALSGCAAGQHESGDRSDKARARPASVPTTQPSHSQVSTDLHLARLTGLPSVIYGDGSDPTERAFSLSFPSRANSLRSGNDDAELLDDQEAVTPLKKLPGTLKENQ
jgi:hypothetical protein